MSSTRTGEGSGNMRIMRLILAGLLICAVVAPVDAQRRGRRPQTPRLDDRPKSRELDIEKRGGGFDSPPRLDDRPNLKELRSFTKRGQLIPGSRGRWQGYYGRSWRKDTLADRETFPSWEELPVAPAPELPEWFLDDYAVSVFNEDEAIQPASVPPIIWGGVVYLAVRDYFTVLNAGVAWHEQWLSAVATLHDGRMVILPLNRNTVSVQGEIKTMKCPTALVNNIMMVPLRDLSEALGVDVKWDASRKAAILMPSATTTAATEPAPAEDTE